MLWGETFVATSPMFKDTLEHVKARLAELRKHRGEPGTGTPDDASMVTWPHDLNGDGEIVAGSWGADPPECA